jgi:predicted transcriptional regulator
MRAPSIKLPEPLDRKLTAIAKKRHTTRAKVLREALETFDTRIAAPTASELAADLVFDGPPDLSTNPKHMAGYGR